MTQQKPLPIATGITGGCNIPSSFHPEVPLRDKIWRMLLGRCGRQPRRDQWGGDCGGLVQDGVQALAKEIQSEIRIQGGRG